MPQTTACPSCQRKLLVPDELLGKSVRCPNCETVFTATTDAPAGTASPTGAEEAPGSEHIRSDPDRASRESDDRRPPRRRPQDEDDDYYDGPEYGRYGGGSRRAALAAVSGPATALQVVSGILIALNIVLLFLVLAGIALPLAAGGPGPKNQNDQIAMMFQGTAGLGIRVVAIILSILIAIGASKMKRLESRGWAMTSSIIALLPCTGCCVLTLPFGIWALVALNKPEVKDYFR